MIQTMKTAFNGLSVYFVTLGCKVNQTESEALAQLFRNSGYSINTSLEEKADVIVINTCTVTNTGGSKSRQVIRRMIKAHPESFVVVMGCYAQTAPGEVLGIEGVNLVLGTQDRMEILNLIEKAKEEQQPQNAVHSIWEVKEFEELPLLEGESRTRAMLKIQEGCNQFCTYCIIPYARGPVRSRRPENALAEAQKLVEAGYKEIVLTGIHTGAYGQDLGKEWDLARLVAKLSDIPGLKRLRLSSIEPMEFTPELIDIIFSSPVVCPHLHIPLQSGSDAVLARMQRPYTLGEYSELLDELYRHDPDLAITTDLIVGFPGETEGDHKKALEFVKASQFAGVHVFPYSKRQGTPAAGYSDQIPNKVKEERTTEMLEAARAGRASYTKRFLGKTMEVLIEQVDEQGKAMGHTDNYLSVVLPPGEEPLNPGQLISVTLKENYLKL